MRIRKMYSGTNFQLCDSASFCITVSNPRSIGSQKATKRGVTRNFTRVLPGYMRNLVTQRATRNLSKVTDYGTQKI